MENHKYHYLYKIINNITGEYYYGVHSTNNINDYYFGSGSKLKLNIKKYGFNNFTKEILEFFPNRTELMKEEKRIVNEELLKDPKCLNVILGGGEIKGSLGLKCVIDNNGDYLMVDKDNNEYVNFFSNRICVNDGKNMKYIKPHELDKYLSEGWEKGTIYDSPGKGKLWVHCEEKRLQIYPHELDKYLSEGWEKGMYNTGDKIWVHKNDSMILIDKSNLDKYLSEGWKRGSGKSTIKDRICIIKDNLTKYIYIDELDKYLSEGWEKKTWEDIIWINKHGVNKRIYKKDAEKYIAEGWNFGRYYKTSPKSKKLLLFDLNGILLKEFEKVTDANKEGFNNVHKYADKNKIYMNKYILKYAT